MSSFYEMYKKEVVPALKAQFGYKNEMLVPRVRSVAVSSCLSEALQSSKVLDVASEELALITGQKPLTTRARKSIATFKLRAGQPIGLKVTLRGARMYEFMNRLFNVALPRVRDFRGVDARGFDGRGNYNFGLKEQIVFQEIDFDKVDKVRGMNITFVTSAKTNEEGKALLKAMGMPFKE